MTRKGKNVKQKVKIFVEGDTEKNYIEGLRRNTEIDFSIESVNMNGGGYSNFINYVRRASHVGFLVFFVVIDLDKALEDEKNLSELIKICKQKTKTTGVPHLIIGNNQDFEVVACAHCPKYKGGNTAAHIQKIFGYKDVDSFKKDKKIYEFLNNKNKDRNFKVAIDYFSGKYKANQVYFKHEFIKKQKGANITINIKKFIINKDALNSTHSNIYEIFSILGVV